MSIVEKLRSAAQRPDGWDLPGLLNEAAMTINTLLDFIDDAQYSLEEDRAGAEELSEEYSK